MPHFLDVFQTVYFLTLMMATAVIAPIVFTTYPVYYVLGFFVWCYGNCFPLGVPVKFLQGLFHPGNYPICCWKLYLKGVVCLRHIFDCVHICVSSGYQVHQYTFYVVVKYFSLVKVYWPISQNIFNTSCACFASLFNLMIFLSLSRT